MKLLVFHNPHAGHEDVPRDRLEDDLQRAGHEVVWVEKGATKLSDALAQPLDAVVVVGGDGSVGAVGRRLAGRGVPIAILPAGTANNIAATVGARPDNLLALLASGHTTAFDLGWVDGLGERRRFLEGVGLGAFADAVALLALGGGSAESREDELSRDLHVLAERVRRLDPCTCELDLDGRELAGEFLLVEVTVGGVIGPNLRLSDGARPGDGLLDVTVVDAAEREELLDFITARARGGFVRPPFTTAHVREARLRLPGTRSLHVDGESFEPGGPAELRCGIEPGALRFLGGDLLGRPTPVARDLTAEERSYRRNS